MGKSVDFGELTQLPLKGWELHSALDRIQKKTNRLHSDIIVVVVVELFYSLKRILLLGGLDHASCIWPR